MSFLDIFVKYLQLKNSLKLPKPDISIDIREKRIIEVTMKCLPFGNLQTHLVVLRNHSDIKYRNNNHMYRLTVNTFNDDDFR